MPLPLTIAAIILGLLAIWFAYAMGTIDPGD
jgi:hypothetical protein